MNPGHLAQCRAELKALQRDNNLHGMIVGVGFFLCVHKCQEPTPFSKTRTETFDGKANELAVCGADVAHTAEGVVRGKGALLCGWVVCLPKPDFSCGEDPKWQPVREGLNVL